MEFIVWAPKTAPPKERFRIEVQIDKLPRVPDRVDRPDLSPPETIVTQIQRFSRVGLVLQSRGPKNDNHYMRGLVVFTPYQALIWDRVGIICVFEVEAPPTDNSSEPSAYIADNWAHITINGFVMGSIQFKIDIVHGGVTTSRAEFQSNREQLSADELTQQERFSRAFARTRAHLIQSAFISYEHENWRHVARACQPLEVAGIKCLIDNMELSPTDNWQASVNGIIKTVDMILIFWSRTFAARKSTRIELQMIKQEIARRKRIDHTPLVIDVMSIDGFSDGMEGWLRESLHAAKRWESFEAYHKATENETAFKEAFFEAVPQEKR